MAGIFQFFTSLLAKVAAFAEWLLLVVKRVFQDLWNIITDVFCWLFDSLLGVAVAALNAIDFPFNPQTYYALIPPETANMLGLIKLPQGITIVVAALVARFLLQTVPFVRWGS
jgi:hypothetical protein